MPNTPSVPESGTPSSSNTPSSKNWLYAKVFAFGAAIATAVGCGQKPPMPKAPSVADKDDRRPLVITDPTVGPSSALSEWVENTIAEEEGVADVVVPEPVVLDEVEDTVEPAEDTEPLETDLEPDTNDSPIEVAVAEDSGEGIEDENADETGAHEPTEVGVATAENVPSFVYPDYSLKEYTGSVNQAAFPNVEGKVRGQTATPIEINGQRFLHFECASQPALLVTKGLSATTGMRIHGELSAEAPDMGPAYIVACVGGQPVVVSTGHRYIDRNGNQQIVGENPSTGYPRYKDHEDDFEQVLFHLTSDVDPSDLPRELRRHYIPKFHAIAFISGNRNKFLDPSTEERLRNSEGDPFGDRQRDKKGSVRTPIALQIEPQSGDRTEVTFRQGAITHRVALPGHMFGVPAGRERLVNHFDEQLGEQYGGIMPNRDTDKDGEVNRIGLTKAYLGLPLQD